MTRKEFEQRTDFLPSQAFYEIIEKAYMEYGGDKDMFCAAYRKNENGLAQKIQIQADVKDAQVQVDIERINKEFKDKIVSLEASLEREQEWKPYEDTENVSREDYEKLLNDSGTKPLTDEEAKELLYNWYGFAKEKITILHNISIYEVNRHRKLRKIGEVDRSPLYNATDWNYIHFNCGCMEYELFNDHLQLYV